jgi:hypothetical protein
VTGTFSGTYVARACQAPLEADAEEAEGDRITYGLEVTNCQTLFPLAINAVQVEGHVELVIKRSYGDNVGDAPAGRVFLSSDEAAALADELRTMSDPDPSLTPKSSNGHVLGKNSAARPASITERT